MSRRCDCDIRYLANSRLVFKWATTNKGLSREDIELLIYLYDFGIFTIQQFKDGVLSYQWNNDKFYRLQREDWIKKIHDGVARHGEHNKYTVSGKAKHLLTTMDQYLRGEKPIPESERRNVLMRGATPTHDIYKEAIKRLNNKKR